MQTKILTLIIALCFVAPFACSNYAEADSSDTTKIQHVLFLVSDDLKASALGCYGNSLCKTPNIDRLAKEGMVFEHAYCQGLWCAPRTSFMFSRYQGEGEINLGQCFREAGGTPPESVRFTTCGYLVTSSQAPTAMTYHHRGMNVLIQRASRRTRQATMHV